jgi:hypothetical protein
VGLARILGYAGAAFVPLLLLLAWAVPTLQPFVLRLTATYGAVILSFLGGIQWGFALHSTVAHVRARRLAVSVAPSLWALVALTLPIGLCIAALVAGLLALLAYEHYERRDAVYPDWYMPLRVRLTGWLSLGLVASLLL